MTARDILGTARAVANQGYRMAHSIVTPLEAAKRFVLHGREDREQAQRVLVDCGERLLGYARRWAVSPAAGVSEAYVFDAAFAMLRRHDGHGESSHTSLLAAAERRMRLGAERPATEFTLPVTLEECVQALLGFAYRYADGRGDAARTINEIAGVLRDAGFPPRAAHPGSFTLRQREGS